MAIPRHVPPPFTCTVEDGYVHVGGEVDLATAPQLTHALEDALSRSLAVVLDLQDVTFLDREGTRAVVTASVQARADGRRLVLLHGPPSVDRMFVLTGTADQVTFFEPVIRPAVPEPPCTRVSGSAAPGTTGRTR